ncbi:hypothetical protein ONS96_000832 [Cadophora gregata f. sp. sojae]|nr:hypothetical protein ONS96_000832 [Cadophora gregata f. sp. sojae]
MAAPNSAQNAQNYLPAAPAAPPMPVYNTILHDWAQGIHQHPWNLTRDGRITTLEAIYEQVMRYTRFINDPAEHDPFHNAPAPVKAYRVERWSWHTIYGRYNDGPLKFPGVDPEPECVRLHLWNPPPFLQRQRGQVSTPVQTTAVFVPQFDAPVQQPPQMQYQPPMHPPQQMQQVDTAEEQSNGDPDGDLTYEELLINASAMNWQVGHG